MRREPDDGKGPACDCRLRAVIDADRHDWRCKRRLWVERNDARTECKGAVDLLVEGVELAYRGSAYDDERAEWAAKVEKAFPTPRRGQ